MVNCVNDEKKKKPKQICAIFTAHKHVYAFKVFTQGKFSYIKIKRTHRVKSINSSTNDNGGVYLKTFVAGVLLPCICSLLQEVLSTKRTG